MIQGSTQFGIAYDIPGSKNPFFAPGALAIQAFQAGTGNLPEGGTGKFTRDGFTITKSAEVTNAIIKNVEADMYTNTSDGNPSRSQRVTVTPNPTSADRDDSYTYTTTLEFFNDGLNYDEKTGEDK